MTVINQITSFKISGFNFLGSDTQLNYTAGVSAGTALPSKALILNPASNITSGINSLTANTLITNNLTLNGTAITSGTISNLSLLDGVTPGTAVASKILAIDSSRNIVNLNVLTATTLGGTLSTATQPNITSVGTLTGLNVSGNITTTGLILGSTLVTTSATEINRLTGLTSSTSELNRLTGLTSSTAELNKLTGLTSSTNELNKLTNVNTTATEFNYLAGITPGTGAASKVLVLDSNNDISNIRNLNNTGNISTVGTISITNSTAGFSHKNTSGGGAEILTSSDGIDNNYFGTVGNNDFGIGVNNSRRLIIKKTTFRIGIGTTDPNTQLEVRSSSGSCLRLSTSISNYIDQTVSSTGVLSLTAAGTAPGFSFINGNVTVTNTTASTNTTSGALIVSGGVGITGSLNISGTVNATSIIGTINTANQPSITTLGTLTGLTSGGVINITNTTISSNSTSGSLIVSGGVGIGNNLNVSGNITGNALTATTLTGTLATASQPNVTSIGTLTGLTSSGVINITNNTATSSATTGALTVAGGVGINNNLNVSGSISGNTVTATTLSGVLSTSNQSNITLLGTLSSLTSNGVVNITNSTSSTTSSNGALIVAGGAGIMENINVGGTLDIGPVISGINQTTGLIIQRNTSPNNGETSQHGLLIASNTSSAAPCLYMGSNTNDTAYIQVSKTGSTLPLILNGRGGTVSINTTSPSTSFSLDVNGTTRITGTTTLANIVSAGTVILNNTTNSSSTTTGALTLAGGLGIVGNTNIGGTLGITGASTLAALSASTLSISGTSGLLGTLSVTGATTLSNTLGVTGATTLSNTLGVTGITTLSNSTNSSSVSTGSLVVSGGVGIGNNLNAGGVIASTSATDGFRHTNDTIIGKTTINSGRFLLGTETNHDLSIITNNSEKLRISSSGNISINNTSNTYRLEVTGTTRTSQLLVGTSADTNSSRMISALDSTMAIDANRFITVGHSNNAGNQAEMSFTYAGDNNANNRLSLGLFGSQFVHLTNNNNVGIRTTSPSFTLDVNGTGRIAGATTLGSTLGVTGATTLSSTLGVTGATTLGSTLGVAGATTMTSLSITNNTTSSSTSTGALTVSGGVGIGGTCNTRELVVGNSDANLLRFFGTSGDVGGYHTVIAERIYEAASEKSELLIYKGNDLPSGVGPDRIRMRSFELQFQTSTIGGEVYEPANSTTPVGDNNTRLFIQNNGNIGINTTSPSTTLDVNGSVNIVGNIALQPTTKTITTGQTSTGCLWHSTSDRRFGMRQIDTSNFSLLSYSAGGSYNDYITCTHANTLMMQIASTNLRIGNITTANATSAVNIIGNSTYLDGAYNRLLTLSGSESTNPIRFEIQVHSSTNATSTNPTWLGTLTNNDLRIGTNNSTRMTITASGNIGVGTTTPNSRLDLGSTAVDQILGVFNNGTSFYGFGANNNQLLIQSFDAIGFYTNSSNGNKANEKMRIQGDGDIKIYNSTISTTSSNGALVVTGGVGIGGNTSIGGNIYVGGLMTSANATSGLVIQKNTSQEGSEIAQHGIIIGSGVSVSSNCLYMGASSSDVSYIQSSKSGLNTSLILNNRGGNVGINTSTVSHSLHVNGTTRTNNLIVGRNNITNSTTIGGLIVGSINFGGSSNIGGTDCSDNTITYTSPTGNAPISVTAQIVSTNNNNERFMVMVRNVGNTSCLFRVYRPEGTTSWGTGQSIHYVLYF